MDHTHIAGANPSRLGYGCMRFTRKGTSLDYEKAEKEVMEAFKSGVNYYDTAYVYSGSEAAIGEIFEKNGIRDKINIATKLPQYLHCDNIQQCLRYSHETGTSASQHYRCDHHTS